MGNFVPDYCPEDTTRGSYILTVDLFLRLALERKISGPQHLR